MLPGCICIHFIGFVYKSVIVFTSEYVSCHFILDILSSVIFICFTLFVFKAKMTLMNIRGEYFL